MKEIFDQAIGEVRNAARFRWYGMIVAWAGCLAGWAWVVSQPDVYEGHARVFVDTSSVLEPVLGNQIVAPNVATQLAYVREALLGREQLERVAREVGLDVSVSSEAEREALIRNLRTSIMLNTAGLNRNSADSVYTISYRHSERQKAVGVVRTLLDAFVEDTLGASQTREDTAGRFLDQQVEEYDRRLAEAERALADFRKENAFKLPGTEGGYFQRMQTEQQALEQAYRDLRILESRRQQLQEQLRGERAVVPGVTDEDYEPPPNSIDARIREFETQLDNLLLEYTERHPDVIALRERLELLLEQRAEQLTELGVDNADQELSALAENPVYRTLQSAITETDVEIATQRANIREREDRVAELQALIDEVPEVEAQLARLNRDYEVIYDQYRALVRSRETQDLTRKASDTDQIDFRIIDPPIAPVAPVGPNRLLLLSMVLAASLGAAAGLCFVLAQLWPVFNDARTMRQTLGLPVLGTVSHAWQSRRRAEQIEAFVLYSGALMALAAVFAVLAGIELIGPGLSQIVG